MPHEFHGLKVDIFCVLHLNRPPDVHGSKSAAVKRRGGGGGYGNEQAYKKRKMMQKTKIFKQPGAKGGKKFSRWPTETGTLCVM